MRSHPFPRARAVALVLAIASAGPQVRAQDGSIVADTPSPAAVEACERSARKAVPASAREPVEVTFTGTPSLLPDRTGDGLAVLRGTGRWRAPTGPRTFAYSCNLDPRTSEAVGLVLRDTTPAAAPPPPPKAPVEPDLSQLSPEACESSAVGALRQRWPFMTQITFDPTTRTYRQGSGASASLHGSVQGMPTRESPLRVFGFECEVDPRDGRVLRIGISG